METTLLVGTSKGAFLLRPEGKEWTVSGPHCDGWVINHVVGDPHSGRIWAGGGSAWSGAGVWHSDDGGGTWNLSKLSNGELDAWAASDPEIAAAFNWSPSDAPFDGTVEAVWALHPGPGGLFAGVKPGNLLHSRDQGETWDMVQGLADYPDRDSWNPGGAGLVLHTIVSTPEDPQKLWVGISAAGVFATEDGGASWQKRNRMGNVGECRHHGHAPGQCDGEVGNCVHNMVRADLSGDLLYQQNHHGVWRSLDGGRNWQDITAGLPSNFGFPISVHPQDPDTLWVIPMNGDSQGRYPPEASAAVWKSSDGGQSWSPKQQGLPTRNCFFTVLRQAMAIGQAADPLLVFGTNSGSLFASDDEGESWQEIARHLPTVLSVELLERGGA